MKLLKFQIQGARKIVAAQFDINEKGTTEISGPNKQGKTTVLDMLSILLFGKDRFTKSMINKDVGKVKLLGELSDGYKIKRTFTEKSDMLEVFKEDDEARMDVKSPQAFLKKIISYVAIEPAKFVALNPKQKKDVLLKESGLDFSDIDKRIKDKEDQRRVVGIEVKNFGELHLPEIPEGLERVDVAALNEEKNKLLQINKDRQQSYEALVSAEKSKIDEVNTFKVKMKDTLDQAMENRDKSGADLKEANELLEILPREDIRFNSAIHAKQFAELAVDYFNKVIDLISSIDLVVLDRDNHGISMWKEESTEEIDKKINNADEINKIFTTYDQTQQKIQNKEIKEKEYKKLTEDIEKLREQKKAMLKEADLGIDNLTIEEDGIYVDGIFSGDWSGMEELKYAVMLGLKRSKLRCVAIDNYDHFDPDSKGEFEQWLEKMDIQAIVTTVAQIPDDMGSEVWFIEDGKILNHPQIDPTEKKQEPTEKKSPEPEQDQTLYESDPDDF